jgi:hypothetical protein
MHFSTVKILTVKGKFGTIGEENATAILEKCSI